ncbi:MAG TPA: hypothetical protein PKB11_00790 [Desulfovibrio sp.]|jgi:hypothetical protein|uniref:hypothetical protein n=1 Tax=Desulfovibrio TaxID=872 RepID=UPI0004889C98|nr:MULTISPECIES: hypothetical protein [Desulfovibrio]MDY0306889.1 hypothetical protein [Desulfovibrionaceae bacterium]HMM37270.1 hypothetical protein [Desulfovibrio sp.]
MAPTLSSGMEFKRALELAHNGDLDGARAILGRLQGDYLRLCEENEALRRQMDEVARVLDLAENMEFDGQKYWLLENFKKKGPFCQVCYDREALLVRLQEHDKHWHCQGCGNLYLKRRASNAGKTGLRSVLGKTIPLFGD